MNSPQTSSQSASPRRGHVGLLVLVAIVAMCAVALSLLAMSKARTAAKDAAAAAALAESHRAFTPRVGQAMLLVQQHYVQAHLAAQAGNWSFAAHELDELEAALQLAYAAKDTEGKPKFAASQKLFVDDALTKLRAAAESEQFPAWLEAASLAASSCNACHASMDHAYVRVQVPDAQGRAINYSGR
jgi:hypothetical protein